MPVNSNASNAGNSNVGFPSLYEDGDQRNYKTEDLKTAQRYHEGTANSHNSQDSKDQRSIANRLAREEQRERESADPHDEETFLSQKDSTLPARSHGNNPSRGAQIDQELREEEEAELRNKGRK